MEKKSRVKLALEAGRRTFLSRLKTDAVGLLLFLVLWTAVSYAYVYIRFRPDQEPPERNVVSEFLVIPYALTQYWLNPVPRVLDARLSGGLAGEFMKRAEQGDVFAQSVLGEMYEAGEGVAHSWSRAVSWWEKAADKGDIPAQKRLEDMYELGRGTHRDEQKAAEWQAKVAAREEADRLCLLGLMHAAGQGAMPDYARAAEHFLKAAELGSPEACVALAEMYEKGRGVEKDLAKARAWYAKACASGMEGACGAQKRLGGK
ncbi:MAG: sel1 repeat family protein [Desulfovibrionaceae bacterium]|nr:sel1 repeat family protein [Desulfovibrionaceae bacterium]